VSAIWDPESNRKTAPSAVFDWSLRSCCAVAEPIPVGRAWKGLRDWKSIARPDGTTSLTSREGGVREGEAAPVAVLCWRS